jgi:hypothetical protein
VPVASHVCATFVRAGSHRRLLGAQDPEQTPAPEHTNGHCVPLVVQLPVASQSCGCRTLHRFDVGEHAAQAPFTQAALQAIESCQWPNASHNCTSLAVVGLHCVVPGWHSPVHSPAPVHTFGHTVPLIHAPVASHVCGVLPEHCLDVGVHTPEQRGVPLVQTNAHAVPSLWLWPMSSQRTGCKPLHRLAPGLQSAQTPLRQVVQV